MNRQFSFGRVVLALFIAIALIGCEKEKDEGPIESPPIDRGHTEVNRVILNFQQVQDTSYSFTAEYYDPDGAGGNDAIIRDTLVLQENSFEGGLLDYQATITAFQDNVDVTSIVLDNYEDYIFCYRKFDTDEIQLKERSDDPDGRELGIYTEWRIINSVVATADNKGSIYVTLTYIQGTKENLCGGGITIFEGFIPYKIVQ